MLPCFIQKAKRSIPIIVVTQSDFPLWLKNQILPVKHWLTATQFRAEPGNISLIPHENGSIKQVILCKSDTQHLWSTGHLPFALPENVYHFEEDREEFAIAWGLGAYQFTRYKKPTRAPAQLLLSGKHERIKNIIESTYLVRDLINVPTDDMGPTELANAVEQLAGQYRAQFKQIIGDDLLKHRFPCIHTVGRASNDPPRFLELRWGNKKHPTIVLIGKGVCFDSGGLDIKNSSAMLLMKKDMAGAAHVMGLARMIMEAKLPVNLCVFIPVVENVISGNAYRPGDIIQSRSGLTIEIGNTDAEGRVILADALTAAVSEKPDLIIDITTLTGAARVAVGTEISAFFSNDDIVANELYRHGELQTDPLWRLPLFAGYRDSLNSYIADINNSSTDGYAGAITAALFLKEFVPNEIPWVHLDMMAWNLKSRPGRPVGGEAMGLRALMSYLTSRFAL